MSIPKNSLVLYKKGPGRVKQAADKLELDLAHGRTLWVRYKDVTLLHPGPVKNLDELGCTKIMIAHRLSTIMHADLILVMRNGEIVERGTHDELMRLEGQYSTLVAAQLSYR